MVPRIGLMDNFGSGTLSRRSWCDVYQVFLVTPSVLLIINISLSSIINNYANPEVLSLLHAQGVWGSCFVIITEVLRVILFNYFHSMA